MNRLTAVPAEFVEAVREFCTRVEAGEIKSVRTYTKFKMLLEALPAVLELPTNAITDDEIRRIWSRSGGRFHGPNVETGTMPEERLLPFLRYFVSISLRMERALLEIVELKGEVSALQYKSRDPEAHY